MMPGLGLFFCRRAGWSVCAVKSDRVCAVQCEGGGGGGGEGGVKYRMLHIPGILDCTYHLHVSVSVCSRF